eukprot:TRINITY_DN3216_c2_g1_i1.p1 TRINITY_DN3216_c2_g1~~TRINITY_DN3216_c2_g1_i1.p1  ORF type:complete len:298 (+),score=59.41 TRINITY_DN3216_c2_g1_i1:50-943(+)
MAALPVALAAAVLAGALDDARRLVPPAAIARADGEFEGAAFWDTHAATLSAAWQEYGRKHADLYTAEGVERYVRPEVRGVWAAPSESALLSVLEETEVKDVFAFELFERVFCERLIEELEHLAASGIPIRRPNGMNRYGVILEDVGLGATVRHVAFKYLAPLAQSLYPEYINTNDVKEEFAFAIRYQEGEDVSLAPHSDASAFTMNLCLGREFTGGDVVFYPHDDVNGVHIPSRPGVALLHRGMLRHGATALRSGVRHNIVMWLVAEGGYVRVAPYPLEEQSSWEECWRSGQPDAEL